MDNLIKKLIPKPLKEKYRLIKRKKAAKKVRALPKHEYESYLAREYKKRTGKDMDFSCPVTLTQKQQWLKLYDLKPEKTLLTDKYAVRKYIKDTIGEQYLIPLISLDGKDHFYDSDEIDFNILPESFVLKCNHGSGYNIIIKEKSKLSQKDIKSIKRKLNFWLKENFAFVNGLELIYETIRPCILIEKYMSINSDFPDYKFMCFSGEPKYVWCDSGRYSLHRRTVYDIDYMPMPFNMHSYERALDDTKPENYEEMLDIVKKLCSDYAYVRIDLYNIEGKIYFGEITFCSGSGYEMPTPDEYDTMLGRLVVINNEKRDNCREYRRQ